MSLIIDCSSFQVIPLAEGKVRLQIENAEKKAPAEVYEAAKACERLSELLGRKVTRWNLAYWRDELGLPYSKIGPKKFTYRENDLSDWAHSKRGSVL